MFLPSLSLCVCAYVGSLFDGQLNLLYLGERTDRFMESLISYYNIHCITVLCILLPSCTACQSPIPRLKVLQPLALEKLSFGSS